MRDLPAYFTVVGYADMDDLEVFTEIVWAKAQDAWSVAVEQVLRRGELSRYFIKQATEINTFMGVCVDVHGSVELPSTKGLDLKIDPDADDLLDLEVYIRTAPGEFTTSPPVTSYHWYDAEADDGEEESDPFPTLAECLDDRYEQVTG